MVLIQKCMHCHMMDDVYPTVLRGVSNHIAPVAHTQVAIAIRQLTVRRILANLLVNTTTDDVI